MPKATELKEDIMTAVTSVPKAAQSSARTVEPKRSRTELKEKVVPLQVRWPASDVKAAKIAAIQGNFTTMSEFMLECFRAHMKTTRKP